MKKIKRLMSLALSFAIVLSMTVTAFAAENSIKMTLVPSTEAPAIGEEFTVEAQITENTGLDTVEIYLFYDKEVVEFLGFSENEGSIVTDYHGYMDWNNSKGIFVLSSANPITKTGTVFKAKFKAIASGDANIGIDADKSYISLDDADVIDPEKDIDVSKVTDMTVALVTYDVLLPSGNGYSVIPQDGNTSPVVSGGSFSFTVDIKEGYNSEEMVVKANDTELEADAGVYTIENITEDQNITISGITESVAASGYTVSLTPDTSNITFSETAAVNVKVASADKTSFNALYVKLTYDPAYLKLETTTISDYEITDKNGTVEIAGYGNDKELGNAFTLNFSIVAKPESGTANATLVQANVDEAANAAVQNAPLASYGDKTAEITVRGFKVELSEDFTGESAVEVGETYTFTAKDKHYTYEFAATMDGADVTVVDHGDGTYTIANVTGNLVIEYATKTPKTYDVDVVGALDDQVTYSETATYMTDYVFAVSKPAGYSRTVAVEIAGASYNGFSVADGSYTIPGKDIIGNIKITVTNTVVTNEYTVEFEGNAAGEATAENMTVVHGNDFTFHLSAVNGYTYDIIAKMGNEDASVTDNDDNTYTIKNVTDNLVITINKTAIAAPTVAVGEYVKLDGKAVYLVTAESENVEEGGALSYDGNVMFWSDEYNAYAYLVISDTVLTQEEIAEKITFVKEATVEVISHGGDVNGTDTVDINDAQLVYNIYNTYYADFTEISMKVFLNADINADKVINVNDAAAIVNNVLDIIKE